MGDAEMKVGIKPPEGRMLFLLQHPLRRRLLALYVESVEPLSPKELADYTKEPLDKVACHVRVLAKHRAVELVEVRPARGAARLRGERGGRLPGARLRRRARPALPDGRADARRVG